MKVIIAGSRHITDMALVEKAIKESGFVITEVVSGGADGVDSLGIEWAKANDIPFKVFPVTKEEWERLGKPAGPIRNGRMVAYSGGLIAIWDGKTSGTANVISQSLQKRLKVHILNTQYVEVNQ